MKRKTHSGRLTQGREGCPTWSWMEDGVHSQPGRKRQAQRRGAANGQAVAVTSTAAGHVEETGTNAHLCDSAPNHTPSRTELAYLACWDSPSNLFVVLLDEDGPISLPAGKRKCETSQPPTEKQNMGMWVWQTSTPEVPEGTGNTDSQVHLLSVATTAPQW